MKTIEIVLTGRPATKKTSNRVVRAGMFTKVLPSKNYENYEQDCLWQMAKIKDSITGPVHLIAHYYMPDKRSRPDLTGLYQATADILQAAGIIQDDKYIVNWDGSKICGFDKKDPRVEITLHSVETDIYSA